MKAGGSVMTEMYEETQRQKTTLHFKESDLMDSLKALFDLSAEDGETFEYFKMRTRHEFDMDDSAPRMESGIYVPDVPQGVTEDTMQAQKDLKDVKDKMDDTMSYHDWVNEKLEAACDVQAY